MSTIRHLLPQHLEIIWQIPEVKLGTNGTQKMGARWFQVRDYATFWQNAEPIFITKWWKEVLINQKQTPFLSRSVFLRVFWTSIIKYNTWKFGTPNQIEQDQNGLRISWQKTGHYIKLCETLLLSTPNNQLQKIPSKGRSAIPRRKKPGFKTFINWL